MEWWLWVLIAVVGVVGGTVLVLAFVRLSRALRDVRHSLEELSAAVPAARQVSSGLDEWRAALEQTRRN